jgi:hypothetical protein
MPVPVVEPIPFEVRELRFVVPLLAQDASYLAASAKIASLVASSIMSLKIRAAAPNSTPLFA